MFYITREEYIEYTSPFSSLIFWNNLELILPPNTVFITAKAYTSLSFSRGTASKLIAKLTCSISLFLVKKQLLNSAFLISTLTSLFFQTLNFSSILFIISSKLKLPDIAITELLGTFGDMLESQSANSVLCSKDIPDEIAEVVSEMAKRRLKLGF